jgi:PadR family transcriptional regulator PadR
MNIENTKAMRKGVLEFCILSVLKEKDAYIGNIRHFEKRKISGGRTIYPLLTSKE